MRIRLGSETALALLGSVVLLAAAQGLRAQSTDQNFPTPVTGAEIAGTTRARDVGDSRLTSYFYAFDGNQGDVFINVVTKNLDGDIDVFTAGNLRPLTKIVVYSDNPDSETGRVIYLRQPLRLILRIEGRTPNDQPATFRIKFAGSFEPLKGVAQTEEPKLPEVKTENESGIRVNSVGTIVEVRPKPTPTPSEDKVEKQRAKVEEKAARTEPQPKEKPVLTVERQEEKTPDPEKRSEPGKTTAARRKEPAPSRPEKPEVATTRPKEPEKPKTEKPRPAPRKRPEPEPDPLANVRLVVVFKDGRKIERPMSDVSRFSVDRGVLTIINKDGSIGRYQMTEVARVTIE